MKVCSSCNINKNNNKFRKDHRNKDGLQSQCKICETLCQKSWILRNKTKVKRYKQRYYKDNEKYNRERARVWRKNNPEKQSKINRKARLKYTFNLSIEEYNILLRKQKGVCAICKQKETSLYKGKIKFLTIDHDHITGKIRGLLCYNCNLGLGKFKDDLNILKAALRYIT